MTIKGSSLALPIKRSSGIPADTDLSGHRVVILTTTGLAYPDLINAEHGDAIAGITTAAVTAGTATSPQNEGAISDPSWSWSIGPVFCGPNGTLVQQPPAGAWSRQIGEAVSATRINLHLFPTYYAVRT